MASGIVVDHKESGVRYAVSAHNFNDKIHKKVRDLKPGETVLGFQPRRKETREDPGTLAPTPGPANAQAVGSGDSQPTPKIRTNPNEDK